MNEITPPLAGFWQVAWPPVWPPSSASLGPPLQPSRCSPQPPLPAPATVTQTVTVAPNAAAIAPQATGLPGATPAIGLPVCDARHRRHASGDLDADRPRPAAW